MQGDLVQAALQKAEKFLTERQIIDGRNNGIVFDWSDVIDWRDTD